MFGFLQFPVGFPWASLHALHTLHTLDTLHTLSTHYTLRFTLYHSTLHTPQSPFHTLNNTVPTEHSTVLHSTLCTPPHPALHSLHWYGNRGRMHKTVEITCFTKVLYVTAFGFVRGSCFLICSLLFYQWCNSMYIIHKQIKYVKI